MTIMPSHPPPADAAAAASRARTSSRDCGASSSSTQQPPPPPSSTFSTAASSSSTTAGGGRVGGGADTRRRITKFSKAREREKSANMSRLVDYFCVISSVLLTTTTVSPPPPPLAAAAAEEVEKNDNNDVAAASSDKDKMNEKRQGGSSSTSSVVITKVVPIVTTTNNTSSKENKTKNNNSRRSNAGSSKNNKNNATTTTIIDGSEFTPQITSRYPIVDYDGHGLNYEGTIAFCYPSGKLPVFIEQHSSYNNDDDNNNDDDDDDDNNNFTEDAYNLYHDDEGNKVVVSNNNNNNNNNINRNGGGTSSGVTEKNHMPKVHYFVNTNEAGQRIYGTCLTIWEGHIVTLAVTTTTTTTTNDVDTTNGQLRATTMTTDQQQVIYLPKCLVILSQHPYLVAFREYLTQLHRLSRMVPPNNNNNDDDDDETNNYDNGSSSSGSSGNNKICTTTVKSTSKLMKQVLSLPIERYITNFCSELPAPPSGSFQVQTTILDSIISIWCPPSNMPIPWVSLPFTHLFQCLDVSNVIQVWMALSLEKQVLVTSTQLSLLTTVCEILLSLLFPLKWSHAYIPLLPHFLVQILSAPMPFLCGIDKNHLGMALGDLSDECLVVDLDKNVVSPGVNMKPIPRLPKFVYQRLLKKVEGSVGHVHLEVRSLRPRDNTSEGGVHLPPELKDVADAMWESRLCLFDEAFMLMFTPEERRKNWLNGDDGSGAGGGLAGSNNIDPILLMFSERQGNLLRAQSQWDAVQEAFIDVNCFLLQKYRKFLVFPSKHNEGSYGGAGFRSQEFLAAQRVDVRDFLEEMVGGQMFDEFITKRLYGSGEADISFFDGAVDRYVRNNGLVANVSGFVRQTSTGGEGGGMPLVGKNLRNMFGGGRGGNALSSTVNNERDLPLLQSARVKRELKTIVPPEPGGLDLPDHILEGKGISNGVVVLVNTRKEADDVGVVSAHDDIDDDAISVTSANTANTATSASTAASKAKQTAGRVYYHYPVFPERLDPELFGKPRGLSSAVRAEYDRQRENVGKFRRTKSSEIDDDEIGTEGGASSARSMAVTGQKGPVEKPATAEVTTFTVFFMTFTAVVGKDLMAVDNDSLDQLDSKAIVSTYKKGKEKRQDDEDVDDIGRLVDEIVMDINQPSTPTRRDRTSKLSPGKGMANRKQPDSPVRNRFNDKLSTLKIMEAKETAKAELEIAFEMLDMMKERGLRADPEAYQCLIDACGRCGDTDRATQLLVRMHEDGIVADGVVYSSLVSAFSTDNAWKQASGEVREELPDWANGASINMDWNSLKVQKRSYIDIVKEKLVDENGDHPAVLNKFKRFVNRNMPNQNRDVSSLSANNKDTNKSKANGYTEQYVTDHVLRQIVLGENLLEVVYPDISIDTDNEFCPRCNYYLSDDDVVNGWVAGNAQEYKTECPNCLTKFVPHFCVQSTLPSFVGSRGPSSALFCERLSPWVLKKELRSVISGGIDDLLSPEWREKESKNAVLFWNLILSFMRYRFPFTFLLQGSFSSSLIAPTPDANDVEV